MTITCMGCEAYIGDDLPVDQGCQSCIDSYSEIMDEDTDKDYVTAHEEEVLSLAYEVLNLSIFLTASWDFPMFEQWVVLSVRWRFFDSYRNEYMYEK